MSNNRVKEWVPQALRDWAKLNTDKINESLPKEKKISKAEFYATIPNLPFQGPANFEIVSKGKKKMCIFPKF